MTLLEYVYSRGICSNFIRGKFYQEREVINSHRKMVAVNNKRGRQSAYGYDEFAIAHMDEVIRKIPVRSKAIFLQLGKFQKIFSGSSRISGVLRYR